MAVSNFTLADSAETTGKFYVGAAGGYADANAYKSSAVTWTAFDETSMSWKFFGGYHINELLSIEGAYNNLGKLTGSGTVSAARVTGQTTSTAWVAALKVSPLRSSAVSPFAKIGLSYLQAKEDSGAVGATTTKKDNSTGMYFGIGAEYAISSQISAAVEYENFGKAGEASSNTAGVSQIKPATYSISLLYKF
jgi:opacity protein-like surface antigen